MSVSLERESGVAPQPENQPQPIDTRETDVQLPPELSEQGVTATPSTPTTTIPSDPLVGDDQAGVVSDVLDEDTPVIYAPADEATLHQWEKGSPADSRTWLGFFWDRIIARAKMLHEKVRVVVGQKQ